MPGADTCRCGSMEGVVVIKGDLKGLVCRFPPTLCNELCDSASVSPAEEVGVGVLGACIEENVFFAEENVARGGDTGWVEWGDPGTLCVGTWSGRWTSSCHFLIFSSASCRAAADGTKNEFALLPLIDGLWKAGIAVAAALNPTKELDASELNHAA